MRRTQRRLKAQAVGSEIARYSAMDHLSLLAKLLAEIDRESPVNLRACTEIDTVNKRLKQELGDEGGERIPIDKQIEALKSFWEHGSFRSFLDARNVCFGLAIRPWDDERCLIEDSTRFEKVIDDLKQWERSPRPYRKCFYGLMHSYFEYDSFGRDIPPAGVSNWKKLREYLKRSTALLNCDVSPREWVKIVVSNRDVFSDHPCSEYAQEVFEGKHDRVNLVRLELGISDASWFTRELVLSQIRYVCELDDAQFKSAIPKLLEFVHDNQILQDLALQMLLNRYAKIPGRPPHYPLKNFSVKAWGNPWLPSSEYRWEGVSEDARQMVGDWLKHEFIELFFTKLSEDGANDTRRLKFWAKYVPLIDNINFALGSDARLSHERDYVELRAKLKDFICTLKGGRNNAFIMTMGDLVVVEFAETSNALYGYRRASVPFDVNRTLRSSPINGDNSLKNDARVLYLQHFGDWEYEFEVELRKLGLDLSKGRDSVSSRVLFKSTSTASQQMQKTETTEPSLFESSIGRNMDFNEKNLRLIAIRFGARIVDNREKGGALWLEMNNIPEARSLLYSWGFRFIKDKGWWKK